MKVIVSFSGGKDSLASLLWVRNNLTKDFITVFCDTGWEHPLTYKYIEEVQEQLGLNLITVKSKKFNGMVTFFTKVVLMRKAQKDYFKCRTQQNLRKCKALETEIDGEIERVNSITGVSSVSKEPRQTNLFTD